MSKKVNPHIRLITVMLTLATWSATVAADIIYVNPNAPLGGNGQTWPTAYKYLQDALFTAEYGNQIWVAQGICKPDRDEGGNVTPGNPGETFLLKNGVGIYGGFPTGGGIWEQRDPNLYKTILTGDLNGDDGPDFANYADNSNRVVTGRDTSAATVLDGFTITGGNASGSTGGGMYNNPNGSLTINKCRFVNNLAGNHGGGMYNRSASNPTITNTLFTNNSTAAKDGGGIYNHSSDPSFSNCVFSGNSAQRDGGAMFNSSNSNPDIVDCLFISNFADDNGGAIYNSDSTPDIIGCTFGGNRTNFDGGGIYNSSSNTKFVNCLLSGNSAADEGGGMYNSYSDPCLINCTFTANDADENGGGMYNWDSAPQLVNSTFNGNTASDGGGMYNIGSNPDLINCIFSTNRSFTNGGGMLNSENSSPTTTNCTFSTNQAMGLGGGIYSDNGNQSIINSIFQENTDGSGIIETGQIYGGSPQVKYSCIQDDDPDDSYIPFQCPDCNNIDDDPMFVQVPSDGGDGWGDDPCTPGLDEGANDDFGDLHLLPGSPCIDTGDNSVVDPNSTDLDGNPRIVDGNSDKIAIVDMGPYEFAPQGVPGDIDGDGDVDLVDFAIVSYQWLDAPGEPSADIAPPGGDGEVNSDDLLVVAANWLTGAEVPAGEIIVNLSMDESWMYQNLQGSENSELTATASIIDDPAGNSSYSHTWEFDLPDDVSVEPSTISGGGTGDASWNFAAPNVNQPEGLSDSGQAVTVIVTVTGDDFANTGSAEAQFGIALLGDVNNETNVNLADRSIINAFWRTGSAGSFTLRDCDINSDGPVNLADRSIANAVWRGSLGQNSVSQPCPFR